MVLASQIARPDVLRRFASTRRRKHTLRNAAVVAAMLGAAAWVIWPGDRPIERGTTTPTVPTAPSNAAAPVPADTGAAASIAAERARLETAALEQDAFLKRLRGETAAVPATAATVSPDAANLNKLFETKPQAPKTAKAARSSTTTPSLTIGKSTPTTPVAPVPASTPAEKPEVAAPIPSAPRTTPATTSNVAAAANASSAPAATVALAPQPAAIVAATTTPAATTTTAVPAITEMVRRLELTTPAIANTAGATLREGMNQIADGKLIEGRKTLSKVLTSGDPALTRADAQAIRDTLASVNKGLVFSDRAVDGDPIAEVHTVASGELLSIIARKYKVTYQFLEQINNVDAKRIRVGQKIKTIKGPFHAIVDKSDFRLDAFVKDADGTMIYITSFSVGVGKDDSTPVGNFIIKQGGKLENPSWTHPRTGKFYNADDAENPIGEYWIALQGTDEHTKGVRGYGIHGTVEPDSIGKQASLGCVRMLAKDIEQVYRLLVDGQSTVVIQP